MSIFPVKFHSTKEVKSAWCISHLTRKKNDRNVRCKNVTQNHSRQWMTYKLVAIRNHLAKCGCKVCAPKFNVTRSADRSILWWRYIFWYRNLSCHTNECSGISLEVYLIPPVIHLHTSPHSHHVCARSLQLTENDEKFRAKYQNCW